ncbi:MAG: IS701 family transposase [Candidatus Tectomicrobia bacterium]
MSQRLPVPPAPGPLEDYARAFDDLFSRRNQREAFRRYLEGLLLPAERNKTLTALANTEPGGGASKPQAQSLQWFLSESTWDPDQINERRLALLAQDPSTAPDEQGVLAIDETGDRKWGTKTAHVGRQYLGSIGKIDNGVVSVHSLWADERRYFPVAFVPYTPAHWFDKGKDDPAFRTKAELALELVNQAVAAKVPFRAVVADNFYGEHAGFKAGLAALKVGYVLALKPSHSWWHRAGDIGAVWQAAQAAPWSEDEPGRWQAMVRQFRDGHQEAWWALEAACGPYGPEKPQRLVIVTTDPATLPELTTWYLVTNLPMPGSSRAAQSDLAAAALAEVVRLYGLRVWIEQSYKQVKGSLGWTQYQVRTDVAMRRHWQLVCLAFSFCWWALSHEPAMALRFDPAMQPMAVKESAPRLSDRASGGEKKQTTAAGELAGGAAASAGLARPVRDAVALLARVVEGSPAGTVASAA